MVMRSISILGSILLAVAPAWVATAAAARSGHAQDVGLQTVEPVASPDVHPDRLCVKLVEGSGAELLDGALRSRTGVDLAPVAALFARAKVRPLITALPWEELDQWHQRACAVLPEHNRPGHLGLWFHLQVDDAAAAQRLLSELHGCPLVAHAYLEPIFRVATSSPPTAAESCGGGNDPAPPTPDFTAQQQYLWPGPVGLALRRAAGIYGARGQGIRFCMVEGDWILGHEDISKCVAANFVGPLPAENLVSANHGLAGAALLVGDRNCFGVTGIVDEIDIKFLSYTMIGSLPNAIILGAVAIQPGDVMMTVLQFLLGQLGTNDWVPQEYLQAEFDATLTATANGRILVNSAANGRRSLDDPRHMRRFDRSYRDSGAIMAASTDGVNLQRAVYCNWGSRVDACAWGENVTTAGYGTLFYPNNDARQAYTAAYAGTSASTPQIAGLVAALQGASKQQLGRVLTTAEIRQALASHGLATPDIIGLRPDLYAIFQSLGIVDGLEVSEPDVAIGGSVQATMTGPPGSGAFLFASFGTGSLDLGLNRRVHLEQASLQTVGFFALGSGSATWTLNVPNDPAYHGVSIYLQMGRVAGSAPIHVSNSCQVTIL